MILNRNRFEGGVSDGALRCAPGCFSDPIRRDVDAVDMGDEGSDVNYHLAVSAADVEDVIGSAEVSDSHDGVSPMAGDPDDPRSIASFRLHGRVRVSPKKA